MSIEGFKQPEKVLVINKELPITEQLSEFVPGKNPAFTALKYLTDPEDIKKYFNERVQEIQNGNADDKNPVKTVLGELDYIGKYGDAYAAGWERFKNVLAAEIEQTMPKPRFQDPGIETS